MIGNKLFHQQIKSVNMWMGLNLLVYGAFVQNNNEVNIGLGDVDLISRLRVVPTDFKPSEIQQP